MELYSKHKTLSNLDTYTDELDQILDEYYSESNNAGEKPDDLIKLLIKYINV